MSEADELADRLRLEGSRALEFLERLTPEDWVREVYTEGTTWSVRSVLAHLVSAERAFLERLFPNVRAGNGGVPEEFSIDRYNARQQEKLQAVEAGLLLDAFRSVRSAMANWVQALDPSELDRAGRHPFIGQTTLREMVKTIYIHDQMHLRDVRKALR